MMTRSDAIQLMNIYGRERIPFLFLIDFEASFAVVLRFDETVEHGIVFDFHGVRNVDSTALHTPSVSLKKHPVEFHRYKQAFDCVQAYLVAGHTYLVNLTFPTRIETNISLRDLFFLSHARYRMLMGDRFVVFSPESFVQIRNGVITSYPMKGTIDASVPNAELTILNDEKETAEHVTIVDLIRNDLSLVASNVHVARYRYVERIRTNERALLQVSSEIEGLLPSGYESNIGDILFALLPAGSISGAPKKRTVEIIREVEDYERGFYTGVGGYFADGKLESAVLIRFIEKMDGHLYYKSGGGITAMSDVESEYKEMIDKVYVPVV